jgi:hypothetical protein
MRHGLLQRVSFFSNRSRIFLNFIRRFSQIIFVFYNNLWLCFYMFELEFKIPLRWRGGGAADGVVASPKNNSLKHKPRTVVRESFVRAAIICQSRNREIAEKYRLQ